MADFHTWMFGKSGHNSRSMNDLNNPINHIETPMADHHITIHKSSTHTNLAARARLRPGGSYGRLTTALGARRRPSFSAVPLDENDIPINLRDRVYNPDPDQMANTLMTAAMLRPGKSLPPEFSSTLLHVLEQYREQKTKIVELRSRLEEWKQLQQEAQQEVQRAKATWAVKENDYLTEIKRLEVLISKGRNGMTNLSRARAHSLISRQPTRRRCPQPPSMDAHDGGRMESISSSSPHNGSAIESIPASIDERDRAISALFDTSDEGTTHTPFGTRPSLVSPTEDFLPMCGSIAQLDEVNPDDPFGDLGRRRKHPTVSRHGGSCVGVEGLTADADKTVPRTPTEAASQQVTPPAIIAQTQSSREITSTSPVSPSDDGENGLTASGLYADMARMALQQREAAAVAAAAAVTPAQRSQPAIEQKMSPVEQLALERRQAAVDTTLCPIPEPSVPAKTLPIFISQRKQQPQSGASSRSTCETSPKPKRVTTVVRILEPQLQVDKSEESKGKGRTDQSHGHRRGFSFLPGDDTDPVTLRHASLRASHMTYHGEGSVSSAACSITEGPVSPTLTSMPSSTDIQRPSSSSGSSGRRSVSPEKSPLRLLGKAHNENQSPRMDPERTSSSTSEATTRRLSAEVIVETCGVTCTTATRIKGRATSKQRSEAIAAAQAAVEASHGRTHSSLAVVRDRARGRPVKEQAKQ